jgi:superfamily II DNA or RNA helicase
VPNLTLQYQWKDKIEKFFLEKGEKIENLVSTTTKDIKKINIITYQSLTSSNSNNDLIMDQIINYWFENIKSEFKDRSEFTNYIEVLKDLEVKSYMENISKYKKRLKTNKKDNVEDILSKKVLDYFQRLQDFGITSIVVDEAHHLTSWWSKVIYKLWENLGENE